MSAPLSFFLGSYVVGVAFTFWMSYEGFAFDSGPEWKKKLAAAGIAVIWPVPATIAGVMVLLEIIRR